MSFPEQHKIDEICQEVFIFAFQKINTFDKGSFKAWLKAIAFNKIRQELQRLKRQKANLSNLKEYLIVTQGDETKGQQFSELKSCIEQLNEEQQQLIRLKYMEHFSTEELSSTIGRTETWVYTTLCRLRKSLKKCLNNQGSLI